MTPPGGDGSAIFGGSSEPPGVARATITCSASANRSSIGGIAATTSSADSQRSGGSNTGVVIGRSVAPGQGRWTG